MPERPKDRPREQAAAIRRLGELLAAMPKAKGAAGIGPIAVPDRYRNADTPTLLEAEARERQVAAAAETNAKLNRESGETLSAKLHEASEGKARVPAPARRRPKINREC